MDNYETPQKIFNEICDTFRIYPKLDVCATEQNSKCDQYFSKSDNSFLQNWSQDFFMNCPYSNCKKWVKYAYLQHIKHNVNGLALLNVSTGAAYWHDFIFKKASIRFYQSRIKFELNGIAQNNPRYDSAFICWSKRKEKRGKRKEKE